MNRKGIKRIGLMSLLVLSLLIFAPAGRAQAAGTGTVKNRVVNVRSNATTASSIVAKLTQGTSVSITSETTGSDGRKWYNVSFKYNGSNKTGCIRADLLNATGTNTGTSASNTSTASVSGFGDDSILAIRVNSARVRKQASISAAMVTTLNKDDQVKQKTAVTGSDGKTWIRVSFTKGGQKTYGYIRSDLLTLVKKGDASAEPAGTTSTTNTNTTPSANSGNIQTDDILTVTATAVRVREDPSDSSKIITNLLQGDKVKFKKTRIGSDGKQWTKVSVTINDVRYHGYIRSDYLAFYQKAGDAAASTANEDTRYVSASAVRVRESASDKSTIVANLLQGDAIDYRGTRTGDDGKQWTKVSFTINGARYHGYIRSDYLSKTK